MSMLKLKIQNPRELLKYYGIKPSKRLGQNFLVDKRVLEKIIEVASPSSKDLILEVGPGLGMLTVELARRVKKVIAVEKDKVLSQTLKDILRFKGINNVEVMNKDILKISDKILNYDYKIVANLPYYITSPFIRKFLEAEHKPKLMVLMVQKEVAQRICAKPPKMSLLAVAVQFYAKPEIVSYVSKKSFFPQPKVDSAILRIAPRKNADSYAEKRGISPEQFFKIVKAGFSSRRKFLINNLSRELKIKNYKLKIVFDQIGLGQKLRAENLSIEDWIKLYYELYKT